MKPEPTTRSCVSPSTVASGVRGRRYAPAVSLLSLCHGHVPQGLPGEHPAVEQKPGGGPLRCVWRAICRG